MQHTVLFDEIVMHIVDRVRDVKRDFPRILDLGAHHGLLARTLKQENNFVVATDLSAAMLKPSKDAVVADEELLPFADESFDLIVSNLALHWINDLPGALAQIKRTLRPDGLFLATFFGGATLHELRACLLEAELAVTGGISPRLSPSIDMQTASALLQRAGFSLPVTDQDIITLTYSSIFALMHDLRGMGQANTHHLRSRSFTRRAVFEKAGELYKTRYATANGMIPATFEVIFLHGWR